MEPIDYKRGIRRRLPLILVLVIIGGVVGAVISVHAKNQLPYFTATAEITAAPKGASPGSLSIHQVEYYAEQQPVFDATGRAINDKHPILLRQDIQVGGGGGKNAKKGAAANGPGEILISAEQPKRSGAVALANAFVKALLNYANEQVNDQHNLAISETNAQILSLSNQIENISAQIQALNKKPAKKPATTAKTGKTTTTTTTPSTTTSTTKPNGGGASGHYVPAVSNDPVSQACDAIVNQGLQCAPASSFIYENSSVPTSLVVTTQPPAGTWVRDNGQVILVISVGPKTTTTTQRTSPTTTTTTTTTTPTTTPTTNGVPVTTNFIALTAFVRTAASSTTTPAPTTTTLPAGAKDQLSYLNAELKALDSQYASAVQHIQTLNESGAPSTGLTFIQPARSFSAKPSKPISESPFAHKSIRIGTGLAIGLILGVLIALLMDGLDKRIRKADRAAVVFGLPVLVEVPKSAHRVGQATKASRSGAKGKRKSAKGPTFVPEVASPYVALVDEPASLIAEAYRRLRVAIMFTPTASVATGPKEPEYGWGPSGNGSGLNGNGSSDGHHSAGAADEDRRQVIMVVSTGFEPTRSEVVANLAAAYAEAGQRALVVTTTDVRAGRLAPAPWTAPVRTDQRVTVPVPTAAVPMNEVPSTGVPATAATGLPGLPGSVPTPPLPPGVAPPGSYTGDPTARVDVGRSPSAGPLPEARPPITVEEVAANCVGQQIAGVARLQLGSVLRGPGEMAIRGTEVLNVARQLADVILVEVPALLATPDAEALARGVDAVVVVAECYFTKVGPAGRASSVLSRMGAPLLGLAVTQVDVARKEQRKIKQNLALPGRDSQRQVPAHMVS